MGAYDVVVIGAGIAGLTATKRLLDANPSLKVANIEAESFGGLVLNVNELDGDVKGSGVDLASELMMGAVELGAESISERVSSLSEENAGWSIETSEDRHHARAVIIASGASLKKLNVPGEEEFEHKGISHCADCDGPLFKDKDVVVAGGGDSALQEARVLSQFCRRVLILNRGERFTARSHLVAELGQCPNVEVAHRVEIAAILGDQSVEKVQVRNLIDNATREVECSGVFGYVGLVPSSGFVPPSLARDADGALKTNDTLRVGNALFAVGAVRSGYGGMLQDAIDDGRRAADEAIKSLG